MILLPLTLTAMTAVAQPAPAPTEITLHFLSDLRRADAFEVMLEVSDGRRFICPEPVTSVTLCTLRGVPVGDARLSLHGEEGPWREFRVKLWDHDRVVQLWRRSYQPIIGSVIAMVLGGGMMTWSFASINSGNGDGGWELLGMLVGIGASGFGIVFTIIRLAIGGDRYRIRDLAYHEMPYASRREEEDRPSWGLGLVPTPGGAAVGLGFSF